jgi:SAM-dependent methyltransferase
MDQDEIFANNEGNAWFHRNKSALSIKGIVDWPCYLIDHLEEKSSIISVVELGCSNGYRLAKIKEMLSSGCRHVGVDASYEAIQDGKQRYQELELYQGKLSDIPLKEEFDLVIVYFVLHWVDRRSLVRSIAEIDRLTKEDGFLILGDFLPDYKQRRRYHHLPDERVFTYKQDYVRIFQEFGTYQELARLTFNHDEKKSNYTISPNSSFVRGYCSVLRKSLNSFYPEV